jgi:Flp pilus assembly protein TadG
MSIRTPLRSQRGAAAVEFALISTVFFGLLLGAAEMGRVLWVWNAAAEATRLGARVAAVCDMNAATIKSQMQQQLGSLANANITLTYLPASCTASTCQSVTITLTGYTEQTFVPFFNFSPSLPAFTTTISREGLSSTNNPACT